MKATIKIKPISVNQAWQGRRYKTTLYKNFQKTSLALMPKGKLPEGKLKLTVSLGFSNSLSDLDNPIKTIIDTLQKKYGFNDRQLYEIHLYKNVVKKGQEYFTYQIEAL